MDVPLSIYFLAVPTYTSGTITCGTIPTPPTSSKMVSDDDNQPVIMCPDESAKYKCDAGGINAIKVSRTFTFRLVPRIVHTVYLSNNICNMYSLRRHQQNPLMKYHAKITNNMVLHRNGQNALTN